MENPYTDILIKHYKNNKSRGENRSADYHQKGRNATCGDDITLDFSISPDGILKDICFHGEGCMISLASASILCETVQGKKKAEILDFCKRIEKLLTPPYENITEAELKDKEYLALADIQNYPARKKCALLAWKTLKKALDKIQV